MKYDVNALFKKIIDAKIPISEMVDFVFLLDNTSVALREQIVRHRIGVKHGDRIGCDIIPEVQSSSWWSQSMRSLSMQSFFDHSKFEVPKNLTVEQDEIYAAAMLDAQQYYKQLVEMGVELEDARNVIPLAAQHRLVWKLNLASLLHIIGKRTCWILQFGLWEPVIKGMIKELTEKVDPIFADLGTPPCIRNEKFNDCLFHLDNETRLTGEDPNPICPLWACSCKKMLADNLPQTQEYQRRINDYTDFWKRDVFSGDRLLEE